MSDLEQLRAELSRIDGRSYPAYKAIKGSYDGPGFELSIDHVQGDPFAAPSAARVIASPGSSRLPEWACRDRCRRTAAADFVNRRAREAFEGGTRRRGSGRGGELTILAPGQQVLERTSAVVFDDGEVELRFTVGLPARGRRVMGHAAAELLCEEVPEAVRAALAVEPDALRAHVEAVEDQQALRAALTEAGLVAFLADGARLPRRSGVDDRPLPEGALALTAPDALAVTLTAPNAGPLRGLGIPVGVTLIVGGGFHGKSTLLRAVELGVYDHVPGDGRERCVARADAVKVRAEDGRSVTGVDIRNFIDDLPGGRSTAAFTTPNASGSTSQAAAVIEALEAGSRCLLVDEDTCATNFMLRDARMQALIADGREPITPYIDRARLLADEQGVSTVMVVGGAGDYFDVADTVIALDAYRPQDRTADAKAIAVDFPTRRATGGGAWQTPGARVVEPRSIDPRKGKRDVAIKVPAPDRALFGTTEIALGAVEQLVEPAQVRAIAEALAWARGKAIDGERTVAEALDLVLAAIETEGLEVLQRRPAGNLAAFRRFELAAFLNRLRGLDVR